MSINAKRKGARVERKVRDWLLDQSWCEHVMKAGASLGMFDLIAFGATSIWFVQVKANRWPGKAEMQRIHECKIPNFGSKYVIRWRDRQREPELRRAD